MSRHRGTKRIPIPVAGMAILLLPGKPLRTKTRTIQLFTETSRDLEDTLIIRLGILSRFQR